MTSLISIIMLKNGARHSMITLVLFLMASRLIKYRGKRSGTGCGLITKSKARLLGLQKESVVITSVEPPAIPSKKSGLPAFKRLFKEPLMLRSFLCAFASSSSLRWCE